jgi:hypothetical protein
MKMVVKIFASAWPAAVQKFPGCRPIQPIVLSNQGNIVGPTLALSAASP